MILVIGGLGFIGTHVTAALLDLGEPCLVVGRRATASPDDRVAVAAVDVTDRERFLDLGRRHRITGIVHLAGAFGDDGPVEAARRETDGLLTVLSAALAWGARRIVLASTIGVYAGAPGTSPFHEDTPLSLTAGHRIPAFKKIHELLADHVAAETGLEVAACRIGAIWGPGGRPASPFFGTPQLVHAAAHGTTPDRPVYTDNGIDQCYVRDCGRAIAALQTAATLRHRVYNVASGHVTTNGEVAAALGRIVPGGPPRVLPGRDPHGPPEDTWLDVSRLTTDTGWRPCYDTDSAVRDYVTWLRAGHPR